MATMKINCFLLPTNKNVQQKSETGEPNHQRSSYIKPSYHFYSWSHLPHFYFLTLSPEWTLDMIHSSLKQKYLLNKLGIFSSFFEVHILWLIIPFALGKMESDQFQRICSELKSRPLVNAVHKSRKPNAITKINWIKYPQNIFLKYK